MKMFSIPLPAIAMQLLLWVSLSVSANIANAQEIQINTNTPLSIYSDVDLNSVRIEEQFKVSAFATVQLEVIVPVDGASFTLIDPSGNIVVDENSPGLTFISGEELQPGSGLPGGVFITPTIDNPADGEWTFRIDYPAATEETVTVASVFFSSDLRVGSFSVKERVVSGEEVAVGVIAINQAAPITGLTPSMTIVNKDTSSAVAILSLQDAGGEFDGQANDGIYSAGFSNMVPGKYRLNTTVSAEVNGNSVSRDVFSDIEVIAAPISINSVQASIVSGANQCIEAVALDVVFDASIEGEYVFGATLSGNNNESLTERLSFGAIQGSNQLRVLLSREEIAANFSQSGEFLLKLDVLDVNGDDFFLATPVEVVDDAFALAIENLCQNPIVIQPSLTVTETLQQGYIAALSLQFSIDVERSANYQLSAKVINNAGDVKLIAFSQFLTEGNNTLAIELLANELQGLDGPYRVISVLVLGAGTSAQNSDIGQTPRYSRWQFLPTLEGDLDNDGTVTTNDVNLLMRMRNRQSFTPGDR